MMRVAPLYNTPCCPHKPQGLGTSSSSEAKEYFARLDSHRKFFAWEGENEWLNRLHVVSRVMRHPIQG